MEQNLKKALSLEGYLEKKSPSMFKGYQKRHFAVHKEGTLLVYSKKRTLSKDVKPKGVIPIEQISQIAKVKGTEREFVLQVGPRQMLLRAQSNEDRELWTSSIALLQEKLLERLQRPSLQAASKESFVVSAEQTKLTQKASWKELDQETKAQIMMDKEKQSIQEHQEEQEVKNEEILKSKGLYAYLEKFDAQKFNQYVKCGFLYKKGKMAKLTKAKKRFFIMISSVSLLNDDANLIGPTAQDLPDTFKLNYLYYFAYDFRGDQSSYLGKIDAEQIGEFEMLDVDRNQNYFQQLKNKVPFGFKFTYKERQFHLFSESLTEIQNWLRSIRAIKAAKANKQDTFEELEINKEDILLQDQMQVKITRKIRRDKWMKRMVYMKKNSLTWAAVEKDDDENYVLIISIKSVVGQENDFHIYTKDDKIFKFRTNSEEIRNEWIKKIEFLQQNLKGEFKDLEKATELPPELPPKEPTKSKSIEKKQVQPEEMIEESNNKEMADFYDNFFKSKKEDDKKKQNQTQKSNQSFFSKIFCCCPGDHENDRGF